MKWYGDLISDDGRIMSEEEGRNRIRQTIERTGRFILASPLQPQIGEISYFAGLPFRVVKHVTLADAQADLSVTQDIWECDSLIEPNDFYFEVEVAD